MQSVYKNNMSGGIYISKNIIDVSDIRLFDLSYNIVGSAAYYIADKSSNNIINCISPILASSHMLMMWARTNLVISNFSYGGTYSIAKIIIK